MNEVARGYSQLSDHYLVIKVIFNQENDKYLTPLSLNLSCTPIQKESSKGLCDIYSFSRTNGLKKCI